MYTKTLPIHALCLFLTLFSLPCFGQRNKKDKLSGISADYAAKLLERDIGTEIPQRQLFHTYEEDYIHQDAETRYKYKNILSFSKIEGNYLEGTWSTINPYHTETYSILARYNFNTLYVYIEGPDQLQLRLFPNPSGVYAREIFAFEIGQNGRTLKRIKYAYLLRNWQIEWHAEPAYNVDLDGRRREVSIYSSTGFVSKTDDYVGEQGASLTNTPAGQTLTDKLEELKRLLEQKVITQEEYNAAREKLFSK